MAEISRRWRGKPHSVQGSEGRKDKGRKSVERNSVAYCGCPAAHTPLRLHPQ